MFALCLFVVWYVILRDDCLLMGLGALEFVVFIVCCLMVFALITLLWFAGDGLRTDVVGL